MTNLSTPGVAIVLAGTLILAGCGSGAGNSSAPTAANGKLAALMGATTPGSLSGQGSGTLAYSISVPAQDGSVTITDAATGAFTYTSYPNFTGTDSFQFKIENSIGTSSAATETVVVTSGALGAQQAVANIGVSTDWVCYWCAAQPFVNVVRQAATFGDPVTGYALSEEGKLDASGWPEVDFRWMILCCVSSDGSRDDPGPESPLVGKYQLTFNGIARIGDDGGTVENQQYNAATNTTTATLDQTPLNANHSGFDMLVTFSNTQRTASSATGTGVTNIRIIRPQFAPNGAKWWDSPTQEFTDPFLASFKGMSTIRYINWTKAIASPEVNWSDRTPGNWPVAGHRMEAAPSALSYLPAPAATCTQYCDWYGTGASWESAIDLANATHTDMWINIPAMATDDYVTNLAALIKSKLDPGLHVYFEWSDEIWNYGNPFWTETDYNSDQMKALLASNPAEAANYAAHCANFADFECHVAEREMQFGQDFASVYGQTAIGTTIRPLLCTQVVQPGMMQEALGFMDKVYGPPARYFYGICGAPYWSPPSTLPSGATAAGVVAALAQGISFNTTFLQTDAATALYYGLHTLTYEGGPGLQGITIPNATTTQVTATLNQVNVDPAMQAQVSQGLSRAFQSGVDMYMYYSSQGSGSWWGATPDELDLDAPKLAGITALAGQMLTRNAGTTLPGNIPTTSALLGVLPDGTVRATYEATGWYFQSASGNSPACAAFNGSAVATGLGYLVNVPSADGYSVSLVMDARGNSASSIELEVDGKSAGVFSVPQTPAGTPLSVGPLKLTLASGLHVVAIINAGGKGFRVDSINFTSD